MKIRIDGKSYTTKRHTRTVGCEIEARGHAARLVRQPDVLVRSVHYFRSDFNRFTLRWNTIEAPRRATVGISSFAAARSVPAPAPHQGESIQPSPGGSVPAGPSRPSEIIRHAEPQNLGPGEV